MMKFLAMLGKFVRSPAGIITLVLAACLGGVYGWGRWLGLVGLNQRLLVMVVLLAIAFLILTVTSQRSRKSSRQVEQSMVMEANAAVAASAAEDRRAREAARQELLAAIDALKRTRIAGGLKGDSALYILPWYLVIGAEGAGKSALIRNSGLQVPGEAPGELKGIGASQNFEWWFTSQAVFLETERRLAALDQGTAGDRAWRAGLEQLRKHRPHLPLNGILVTVPVDDLLDPAAGALEAKAKLLRQRLDTLIKELDILCPVYLIVTKADLIHGFREYFADLGSTGREQVWGATLTEPLMTSGDPGQVVEQEFQVLTHRLLRRRLPSLVRAEEQDARGKVYLFPLEFSSLRKPLRQLARILAEPDPMGSTPLLRGFYFTSSGAGGGAMVESVLAEVSRVMGLPGGGGLPRGRAAAGAGAPPPSPVGAAGMAGGLRRVPGLPGSPAGEAGRTAAGGVPLFLKTLFLQVLIPDQRIACPAAGAAKRQLIWRWVGRGAAFAGLGLLAILMLVSFGHNRMLVGRVVTAANDARHLNPPPDASRVLDTLNQLNDLRANLEELDRRPRLADVGLTLARSGDVARNARHIYLQKLSDILLQPSHEKLSRELNDSRSAWKDEFPQTVDKFKVYDALANPEHGIPARIAVQLCRLWGTTTDLIPLHIEFAWRHPAELKLITSNLRDDNDLRAAVYRALREQSKDSAFLDQVVGRVNADASLMDITLKTLSPTDVMLRDASDEIARVKRAYTREAWQKQVKQALQNPEVAVDDDWLLTAAGVSLSRDSASLIAQYAYRYLTEWSAFLHAVEANSTGNAQTNAGILARIALPKSAFSLVLDSAKSNLDLHDDLDGIAPAAAAPLLHLKDDCNALFRLFEKPPGGDDAKPPIEGLRELYKTIGGKLENPDDTSADAAITAAVAFVSDHCTIAGQEVAAFNGSLQTFLMSPIELARSTRVRRSVAKLNDIWNDQIYQWYRNNLEGHYPLGSGSDVARGNFIDFFKEGGRFDSFVRSSLAAYVTPEGTAISSDRLNESLYTAIKQAHNIRLAMFSAGDLRCDYTLWAHQITVSEGRAPSAPKLRVTMGKDVFKVVLGSENQKFTWDSNAGATAAKVEINFGPNQEGPKAIEIEPSVWSLFKLLDKASYSRTDHMTFEYRWRLVRKDASNRDLYALNVWVTLQANTDPSPFSPGFFRFDLPSSLQ